MIPSRTTETLTYVVAIGALLVLLIGLGALAYIAFVPDSARLLVPSGQQPVEEQLPTRSSDDQADATQVGSTQETPSPASTGPTTSKEYTNYPSGYLKVGSSEYKELEKKLLQSVEDYYKAIDSEDWDYAYDNLASHTRRQFTEEEWKQKNQWFADNYPRDLSSLKVGINISPSKPIADITVDRAFEGGPSSIQGTYFVYEDGSWKHQFTEEEFDAFMPGASFEAFVAAQQSWSLRRKPAEIEKQWVENAIRNHYAAIGDGDFETAYSYFGPTYRSTTNKERWIADEASHQVKGSTVNTLEVNEVSEDTATATVDVRFEDDTGTSRFFTIWRLLKKDGFWRLDEQLSTQKMS